MQVVGESEFNTALTEFTDNWIWRTVLCLVEHPNFDPSPKWIAARIGTSVEKVVDAIEGLQRLNLIVKSDNTYKVTTEWLQILPKDLPRADLLRTHIRIAPQILSRLDENDGFTVQFFTGNKELLKKYAPKFIALYKEMEDEAKQKNITEVMASELSFVQVTNNSRGDV